MNDPLLWWARVAAVAAGFLLAIVHLRGFEWRPPLFQDARRVLDATDRRLMAAALLLLAVSLTSAVARVL